MFSIELIEERFEEAGAMVVCPKNQYIFVESYQSEEPNVCSRMMIYSIKDNKIKIQATIDQFLHDLFGYKGAMACLGYFKKSVVFLGLSSLAYGVVQMFIYNTATNDFKELGDVRASHEEYDPCKIVKLGNSYYYTGLGGSIMRLNLKFNSD